MIETRDTVSSTIDKKFEESKEPEDVQKTLSVFVERYTDFALRIHKYLHLVNLLREDL
jgi:hypothetical protein